MSEMSDLQKIIHEWAIRKEWRGEKAAPRPFVADLALFTSEISEALEEIRKNADPKHFWLSYTVTIDDVQFKNLTEQQVYVLAGQSPEQLGLTGKPEGVGPELADLVIRVLETCEEYGLDLFSEIERKMAYNEGREIRHGGLLL